MEKTIEERAKDYAEEHLLNGFYDKGTENAYIQGATDQLKIDKEKVFHALEKVVSPEVLKELMKIMEAI